MSDASDAFPTPDPPAPRGWTPVRPLTGGFQSPVWLVRDEAGGRDGVLKWAPVRPGDTSRAEDAVRQAAFLRDLAHARAHGYPAPAVLAHGATHQLRYLVTEYVVGESASRLTVPVARALLPVLGRQRGLSGDPGHCWSAYAYGRLLDRVRRPRPDQPESPHRARSRGGSREGAAFDSALAALLSAVPPAPLPTGDLVHGDFRLGNVLLAPPGSGRPDPPHVAGVVDLEAAGGGTRVLDCATLLTEDEVDQAAGDLVREAGERVAGPAVFALSFAWAALELAEFVRGRSSARFAVIAPGLTARLRALTPANRRRGGFRDGTAPEGG